MKIILFLVLLFLNFNSSAQLSCEDGIIGDAHWINPPKYKLNMSNVSDHLVGLNCRDQIVVNDGIGIDSLEFKYAYLLPEVIVNKGHYYQEFSIDFEEIFADVTMNTSVVLIVMDVASDNTLPTPKVQVKIKKKLLPDGVSYVWKFVYLWYDINQPMNLPLKDYFWVSDKAVSGELHFRVEWSQNYSLGDITTIRASSGLKDVSENVVLLNVDSDPESIDPDKLQRYVNFGSPHSTIGFYPEAMKVGIIGSSHILNEGIGVVITQPDY